jgi:hypothetical protein
MLVDRRPALAAAVAACAAGTALPGPAAATTVATPNTPAQVRAYAGTIVFSVYDSTAHAFRLAVRDPGAAPRVLDVVAPSPTAFRADIGPGRDGRLRIVFQRCAGYGERRTDTFITRSAIGCELAVVAADGRTPELPIRNANDPAHDDIAPTIWRGRIAWARRYPSGAVVYTKLLTAPRAQPSTRLPGVPATRCIDDAGRQRCATTRDREVAALELSATRLAVSTTYTCRVCAGIAQAELLVDRLAPAPPQTTVARIPVGLAGQFLLGPSFVDGELGWYAGCGVNEPACRTRSGPYRYNLTSGAYRHAPGPIQVEGFADAGEHLYEVLQCEDLSDPPGPDRAQNPACRIEELPAPAYAPVKPPITRTL